jgi:DNA repair protein RadC
MNIAIKDLNNADRPREKMNEKGRRGLTDVELLSILLGSGTKNKSVICLANEMLSSVNYQLNEFSLLEKEDLLRFKGVGEAKAFVLLAAIELGRRRIFSKQGNSTVIKSADDAYKLLALELADLMVEEFYVVYLNRANKVLKTKRISIGGISGTYVDAKVVFKWAIDLKASAIILAHNHPSGQLFPSEMDKKITKQITEFGKLIDVKILDHLIISNDKFFSFAESGLL